MRSGKERSDVNRSVSVVMPAYNEATHIASNLRVTVETLSSLNYDFEVILVDDGSPDRTYREASKLIATHGSRVRVVHYETNQGKGNALMCGSWFARGDIIVFLDADMDLHPEQVPVLIEMMGAKEADVVIGSKMHPLSRVNYPLVRRAYSWVYYSLIRLMFGLPVKDTQTGLKAFKREVLDRVFPKILAKRFAFDIEVLANAHRLGYKIIDAPVTLNFQRRFGRIRSRDVLHIVIDTLAIFYRMHILRYYDRMQEVRLKQLPVAETVREIVGQDVFV
jgi:glycosyltransferase involved in cell wall biosynthesis